MLIFFYSGCIFLSVSNDFNHENVLAVMAQPTAWAK